ncbi:RPEL repeat-containing protein [Aspergillus brunneoviolaceus CBS 621.78]|uniref:RPEL repeat protein n=2 Tax=Aspergillus TaxID=5052 RepID=A0A8G1RPF6_9EURO|nr:hypothetical protein BO95DRAFT_283225 [Aspergillus brunneoviolaceus CBS 621.78]XP_040801070.1 uncharacterized protein BO72DRAFT_109891 [Aspergillus fijiensis CBS 313.89]RAH49393.1 hypothetical protein BO95DRAFT_283225 [Aspergillus brunneoviolaceus CBS 621.78]RAK77060.1 hypothetical protein BO72DRAFT_109891 [Aspergillus fijiensis CBS 313.89]
MDTSASAIDQTPLSASPTERRDSLEKHLQHRPDVQDLKERHILLDTNVAPSLQAAHQDLARHRTADDLKKHLEHRPDREELVERNILPSSTAAPALQANARELEKHMLADHLDQKIGARPAPDELISQGILTEDEDPRFPTV